MLNPNKYWLPLLLPGLVICAAKPLLSQSTAPRSPQSDRAIPQVSFKPPPTNPRPRKTTGAGSRQQGECFAPSPTPPLIALVPQDNYGLTLAAHPTFFVYLPQTSAKQLILSIREEGNRHHSQTILPIHQSSGIIQIQPSENTPPLEVGKTYQWSVILVCREKPGPNDPAITSWIKRIDAISAQMNPKNAVQQATWYGEQGIWYDTLKALAQAQDEQPQQRQVIATWSHFLTSVGLEAIANQPLLPLTPLP